jgi:hypothetical protein
MRLFTSIADARWLPLAILALLSACASTPTSRIEKDPETFAKLTVEQQEKVKNGNVSVGFDEAAVKLAMGEPSRVIERETAEGISQVWVYYAAIPNGYGPYGCNGFTPYSRYYYTPFCGAGTTDYIELARITFQGGKVLTVERSR